MRSEYFRDFGIPPADYEVEGWLDRCGTLRLCFIRNGVVVSLDAADARLLQLILRYAGEWAKADEIGALLDNPKPVRRTDSDLARSGTAP